MPAAAPARAAPDPEVRGAVRTLLMASERYHALHPDTRLEIAGALVKVADTAQSLSAEAGGAPQPLAMAQGGAGAAFSGAATDRLASTTQAVLNAVSFPRFVTELITGVFKAMNDSNQQQLQAYVDLIRNVAATTEGFADAQVGVAGARSWLAERFPNFRVQGPEDDTSAEDRAAMTPDERAEAAAQRDRDTRLVLAPGQQMPSEGAMRAALSLHPEDPVPSGDPEGLVGFARAAMARNRQQMLSSMVMMGLQRIVIESGRISAGMRFHIDTRSAANDDRGSSFDLHNEVSAEAHGGMGLWGAAASVKNTIGFVTTEQTRTTEEINTSVDLNSQVELVFRSDYVPLTRLAGVQEVDRIRVNTLNPTEESRIASASDAARTSAARQADSTAEAALNTRLASASRGSGVSGTPPPTTPAALVPVAAPTATPTTPATTTPTATAHPVSTTSALAATHAATAPVTQGPTLAPPATTIAPPSTSTTARAAPA